MSAKILLSKLRDGELALNPEMTTALLAMVDAIRQMLASVEAIGNEGERDDQELIQTLTRLLQGSSVAAKPKRWPCPPSKSCPKNPPVGGSIPPAIVRRSAPTPVADAAPKIEAKPDHAEHAPDHGPAPAAETAAQAQGRTAASESSIRVDVTLLDKLMNLVGELVLARNQILQFPTPPKRWSSRAQPALNLITTELQEGVMKTRMQPIGNIWSKFPRTVRDVAPTCGKQVRLEMEGKETELDKTIIEAIKDPLTHIVRNSVDHGIEKPEPRVAVGKPAEGRLLLRAYHEGGQVIIEISDDGGGIDADKSAAKPSRRA